MAPLEFLVIYILPGQIVDGHDMLECRDLSLWQLDNILLPKKSTILLHSHIFNLAIKLEAGAVQDI
jgi:hypothetical protein